jgi:hypothetical protein
MSLLVRWERCQEYSIQGQIIEARRADHTALGPTGLQPTLFGDCRLFGKF